MTFDDLQQTLGDAVQSGSIGTPVAVRVRVHVANRNVDCPALLPELESLVATIHSSPVARLSTRRHVSGGQLNLLIRHEHGQTTLATLSAGFDSKSSIHLLVIGNRGVIRLEGEELEWTPPVAGRESAWYPLVENG